MDNSCLESRNYISLSAFQKMRVCFPSNGSYKGENTNNILATITYNRYLIGRQVHILCHVFVQCNAKSSQIV